MAGYNKIIAIGTLGADPELKKFDSGVELCKFPLITVRDFKNSKDEIVTENCLFSCDVWGNLVNSCMDNLKKDSSVLLEGRMKYDTWEHEGKQYNKMSLVVESVNFLSYVEPKKEEKKEE